MIASLIVQGYSLFLFWASKTPRYQFLFECCLLFWITETAVTAAYLAWKYLP